MINEEQRKLLQRAREVEQQRIEITAQALENRIADKLPPAWLELTAIIPDEPVELCLTLYLTEADGDVYTERECRETIKWLGCRCDEQRQIDKQRKAYEDGEDDDS